MLPFEKSFYVGSVSFVYSEIWLLLYKNYLFEWYRQNNYSCISQIIYSRLDILLYSTREAICLTYQAGDELFMRVWRVYVSISLAYV
jgi:hypothetical protein